MKEQAKREVHTVSSTRRLDSLRRVRRAPPAVTQTPNLPFIYCVFNSEHAADSLLGGRRGPLCLRAGSRGLGGVLKAGGRHGSSLSQSPTTTSSSATSTRPGT